MSNPCLRKQFWPIKNCKNLVNDFCYEITTCSDWDWRHDMGVRNWDFIWEISICVDRWERIIRLIHWFGRHCVTKRMRALNSVQIHPHFETRVSSSGDSVENVSRTTDPLVTINRRFHQEVVLSKILVDWLKLVHNENPLPLYKWFRLQRYWSFQYSI